MYSDIDIFTNFFSKHFVAKIDGCRCCRPIFVRQRYCRSFRSLRTAVTLYYIPFDIAVTQQFDQMRSARPVTRDNRRFPPVYILFYYF